MSYRLRDDIRKIVVGPNVPISECVSVLDRGGVEILAICDEDYKLLGIVTDGDIRRAFLKKIPFDSPCISIASIHPLTANEGISPSQALQLLNHGKPFLVNQLPILDSEGRIVDVLLRSDLQKTDIPGVRAVVMAGGFGTRLLPLTEGLPKPMLPLGDRPVMEHIIEQLKDAGISNISVTTHYLPEKIREHFGDGSNFDVTINYVEEQNPLGTAGSLSLVEIGTEPILVINGDILTKADIRSMIAFHKKYNADMTVGVRQFELKIPYGVLDCDEMVVTAIREKPTMRFFVNAGLYLLEPHAHVCIPRGMRYDMTDLMGHLIASGKRVVSFPIIEYWMDIGQVSDYERAKSDVARGKKAR